MTSNRLVKEKNLSLNFFCLFISIVMLIFSQELKVGVIYGLNLSVNTIIPTLFPFFVLSDIWAACLYVKQNGIFSRIFEKLFGISGLSGTAMLCGIVCGFPLGAKVAMDYYENKIIEKDEAERLCVLSSNPSAAFVISGIGAGMYSKITYGVLLYFCVIFSTIIVGVLFRRKSSISPKSNEITRQRFNLVLSIKNAGISSIIVSSYIIFFSALIKLWCSLCKNNLINILFSCIFEVSSACNFVKETALLPTDVSLTFTAFALGFSGISVHLQAFSFMPKEISRKRFILLKGIVGIFSAIIAFILFMFIK